MGNTAASRPSSGNKPNGNAQPTRSQTCVLITGASSGIGAALAVEFAAPGIELVLLGRNKMRLEEIGASCQRKGAQVKCSAVDVRDKEAMAALIAKVNTVTPLDLVVANAGVMAHDLSLPEALHAALDTNLRGTLNTIAPALEAMLERGAGHIAVMSSISAIPSNAVEFAGRLQMGFLAYTWTKQALLQLAAGLRAEVAGTGVTVSAVCPPIVDTPMARTIATDFGAAHELGRASMSATDAAAIIRKGLLERQAVIAFPKRVVRNFKLLSFLPQQMLANRFRSTYKNMNSNLGKIADATTV